MTSVSRVASREERGGQPFSGSFGHKSYDAIVKHAVQAQRLRLNLHRPLLLPSILVA